MMLPGMTSSPPKRLTPRRCALESRPLRVEPAPFLDANSWRSKRNIAARSYQTAGAGSNGNVGLAGLDAHRDRTARPRGDQGGEAHGGQHERDQADAARQRRQDEDRFRPGEALTDADPVAAAER